MPGCVPSKDITRHEQYLPEIFADVYIYIYTTMSTPYFKGFDNIPQQNEVSSTGYLFFIPDEAFKPGCSGEECCMCILRSIIDG